MVSRLLHSCEWVTQALAKTINPPQAMRLQLKCIDCKRMEACDERTPLGSRCVPARQGWAGETSDFFNGLLASRHGSHDKKRLGSRCDCVG